MPLTCLQIPKLLYVENHISILIGLAVREPSCNACNLALASVILLFLFCAFFTDGGADNA
eukprot:scaffold232041_cov21-Tisochrysis_lutea.AAC.1